MVVQSMVASSNSRPLPHQAPAARMKALRKTLRDNFSLTTLLLIGALLQVILVLILPKVYALTPAVLLLAARIIDTLLITFEVKENPYLKGVVYKKSTAQVMDKDGNYPGPGAEKIAVLLIGAKSNHPLGIFAPDFRTTGGFLDKMTAELESRDHQDTGFLGQSQFTKQDENGANEFLFLSYWRSIEDVHAYAHSPTHREAWKWWNADLKAHKHIGFMHEVYEADRGAYESVYINFQPTDLGATTYLKRNGKIEGGSVGDEWVSGLLDANRGLLRTSAGRRGQTHAAADEDVFGVNPYMA